MKPKRNSGAFARAVDEVKDRLVVGGRGDWKEITPATLLGLYAVMHEKVYGVAPEELADDWYPAFSTAKKFLERNGGRFDVIEFVRWVWQRERHRYEKESESDFSISWRYQFSQKLVTRYRVAKGV